MSSPSLSEIVSAEIRAELARQRRSYRDLALVLEVAPSTISERMAGRYPWTLDEFEKTSKWLGVSLWELMNPPVRAGAA